MATIPEFKRGTPIIGQAATGAETIGFVIADGATEGKANIILFAAADGAASIVADATYVSDSENMPTGAKAFRLNWV